MDDFGTSVESLGCPFQQEDSKMKITKIVLAALLALSTSVAFAHPTGRAAGGQSTHSGTTSSNSGGGAAGGGGGGGGP
jgi:hypothetical protein